MKSLQELRDPPPPRASAAWRRLVRLVARILLFAVALLFVIFLSIVAYGLMTGRTLQDSVGMATVIVILIVATPISLITTGRLPYVDL